MGNKIEIRERVRNLNHKFLHKDKKDQVEKIWTQLENLNVFQLAKNIFIYYSLPDEVDTHKFINKWKYEKNIYLPRVIGNDIDIIPFEDEGELTIGRFNIMEPSSNLLFSLNEMDIAIIPAVAISEEGCRIGRGKGFYDRLLANSLITKVGIIFSHQLCEPFNSEPHDVKMDYIITDNRTIKI